MIPFFLALIILSGIVGSVAFLREGRVSNREVADLRAADFEIKES